MVRLYVLAEIQKHNILYCEDLDIGADVGMAMWRHNIPSNRLIQYNTHTLTYHHQNTKLCNIWWGWDNIQYNQHQTIS